MALMMIWKDRRLSFLSQRTRRRYVSRDVAVVVLRVLCVLRYV